MLAPAGSSRGPAAAAPERPPSTPARLGAAVRSVVVLAMISPATPASTAVAMVAAKPSVGVIGGDFQEQRDLGGHRAQRRRRVAQELAQVLRLLEGAQLRRIRRADVERQIVGGGRQPLDARAVIARGVGELGAPALADADAARHAARRRAQRRGGALGARVVEAHAVHDRALGRKAEHPRARIARLRMGGEGPALDEAETRAGEGRSRARRSCRSRRRGRPDSGTRVRTKRPASRLER